MRQVFLMMVMALLSLALLASEPALARNYGAGSGRSAGSSARSGKAASGSYITRHCKTAACVKKHPSGTYAAPTRRKAKRTAL